MGCYFVHKVSCDSADIENLLMKNNLLDDYGASNNLFMLNLKRCSEQDFINDNLEYERLRIALSRNKSISYMSKDNSGIPACYISKAFPDLAIKEDSYYDTIGNSEHYTRIWSNGKCRMACEM